MTCISDLGPLMEALSKNPTLRALELHGAFCFQSNDHAAVKALSSHLSSNACSLRKLILSPSYVDGEGLSLLMEMLSINRTLENFEIHPINEKNMGRVWVEKLVRSMITNDTLTSLDIETEEFHPEMCVNGVVPLYLCRNLYLPLFQSLSSRASLSACGVLPFVIKSLLGCWSGPSLLFFLLQKQLLCVTLAAQFKQSA